MLTNGHPDEMGLQVGAVVVRPPVPVVRTSANASRTTSAVWRAAVGRER
jgi:hypothetical protein